MSEVFTNRPGKFVQLKDTIEGFSGKFDIIQLFLKEKEMTILKQPSICKEPYNKLSNKERNQLCNQLKNDRFCEKLNILTNEYFYTIAIKYNNIKVKKTALILSIKCYLFYFNL